MRPAAKLASVFLDAFDIEGKPDLPLVCRKLGLRVKEVDSSGFDGALVCSAGSQKGIIAVRRSIREASRKMFTVAHEIAHFVIPYHRRLGNVCESRAVEGFGKDFPPFELEANEFAAELLLPSKVVRSRFNLKDPLLNDIATVAREFGTSLTAATYRYLDLTEVPCAMVWSEAGSAVWYNRSETFPFYIPKSAVPASESIAGRLFSAKPVAKGPQGVSADLWLDLKDAARVKLLTEDSFYLSNYNAVLSLLQIVRMDSALTNAGDDDGVLAELDPEEFTLRRRRWPR